MCSSSVILEKRGVIAVTEIVKAMMDNSSKPKQATAIWDYLAVVVSSSTVSTLWCFAVLLIFLFMLKCVFLLLLCQAYTFYKPVLLWYSSFFIAALYRKQCLYLLVIMKCFKLFRVVYEIILRCTVIKLIFDHLLHLPRFA